MEQNNSALTGGCQCGAVRFRVERTGGASICHCRMCQKAFGGFYGPLVSSYGVVWTRNLPTYFQSSNKIRRGFCKDCGTPLVYENINLSPDEAIEVAIGAFDHPALVAPTVQVNLRDKQDFVDGLADLPTRPAEMVIKRDAFYASIISHQHPDHDTAVWPPAQGFAE